AEEVEGVSPEDVLALAAGGEDSEADPLLDLKDGEWAAFLQKLENGRDHGAGDFIVDGWRTAAASETYSALTSRVLGVGQVRRVREVRALRGFRRHDAD
ncbi:hypothetical protein B5181_43130, partial [Streptomyces sp. 4F]